MKKAFKWIGVALFASIAVFTGHFYFGLYSGATRMAEKCEQIKAGATWTDLVDFGLSNDFLIPQVRVANGVVHLVEGRTMGRFGCQVTVQNGSVVAASPLHMD